MLKKNSQKSYILLLLLAIFLLAVGGIFVKMSKIPPIATGFYRILFAMPLLVLFSKFNKEKITKDKISYMFLSGILLGLALILWNFSFKLTSVANATLLANMVPFTIIPISYFMYNKRFNKNFYFGLGITLIGLIALVLGKSEISESGFIGDGLALITSVFYGLFLFMVSKLRETISSRTISLISSLGSLCTLFVAMVITEGFSYPRNWKEIIPLLGLSILSHVLGQGLLSYSIGKLEVSMSSVLVLIQPVIAAILSFVIFREVLSIQEILGMIIVILGISVSKNSENGRIKVINIGTRTS